MASDYSLHSRFFFASKQKVQDAINAGTVNQWDIVLCSDTQEMLLINEDFDLIPIHSKVYRFVNIATAEEFLNRALDTYQGQLVSILDTSSGTYRAYIVNHNGARYYVTPISVYSAGDIDYDQIGHRPIEQLYGNVADPVVLSELNNGLYKVNGSYKVCDGLITIFQSNGDHVIMIEHNDVGTEDENTTIKVITNTSITNYIVDNTSNVTETEYYATQEWVKSQGYMTESDFDAKIQALDIMTREEALEYIQSVLREGVETIVYDVFDETFNTRFDIRLGESMQSEDNESVARLFNE